MIHLHKTVTIIAALILLSVPALAEEPTWLDRLPDPPNWKTPTMGGTQLWADQLHFRDWRIQRNTLTGHCRLLDGDDYRHAWGTYKACDEALQKIRKEKNLQPYRGKAVVALHGLWSTRGRMDSMCDYLEKEGGYHVYNVTYPTTQGSVAEHAKTLDRILRNLEGVTEINFVAHSLGNIVIRHYLADQTDPAKGLTPDRRIRRLVMIGPPNQGARLAEKFGRNKVFEWATGESGEAFSRRWDDLEKKLTIPKQEFGIIAGGSTSSIEQNPLIAGNDDLLVTVEETRLPGARDFVVLPVKHFFMPGDETVQQVTLRFIEQGYFTSAAGRKPIPRDYKPAEGDRGE